MPMHAWEAQARDHFGLTSDPLKAGFILPNGDLLDLVTKARAGPDAFVHGVHHGVIAEAVAELPAEQRDADGLHCARVYNETTGSLRMHATYRVGRGRRYLWLGVEVPRPPNRQQIRAIQDTGAEYVGCSVETIDGHVLGSCAGSRGSFHHFDTGAMELDDFFERLPQIVSAIMAAR